MPQFKISVGWEVYATTYIEADNLKQAIEIANEDDFPLPTDTNYIDGTFNVDMESTIELNRKENNYHTIFDVIEAQCTLEPIVCANCGSTEVTFNQGIGDGQCSDCGEWQLEFLNKQ